MPAAGGVARVRDGDDDHHPREHVPDGVRVLRPARRHDYGVRDHQLPLHRLLRRRDVHQGCGLNPARLRRGPVQRLRRHRGDHIHHRDRRELGERRVAVRAAVGASVAHLKARAVVAAASEHHRDDHGVAPVDVVALRHSRVVHIRLRSSRHADIRVRVSVLRLVRRRRRGADVPHHAGKELSGLLRLLRRVHGGAGERVGEIPQRRAGAVRVVRRGRTLGAPGRVRRPEA
mmetsp:Transcript_1798/g.5908  ORF Transcript_1798/g.5908 Transcript_1798/m.5908 type:complete len:231 (+) Transcript_1798:326-1018(+)